MNTYMKYTCIHKYIHKCLYIFLKENRTYMYAYIYVHIYIFIHNNIYTYSKNKKHGTNDTKARRSEVDYLFLYIHVIFLYIHVIITGCGYDMYI